MSELPASAYKNCMICGSLVTPSTRTLREVVGFTSFRSGGGANHIIGRRETGREVCIDCSERVRRGDDVTQEALL
jgi:hypothetical protein